MNTDRQKAEERFRAEYDKLNKAQQQAVNTIDGPVLVIAGPGTGKTQILAARIARILEIEDIYASNILCLTYTDAGAIKMRERLFNKFIGSEAYRVNIHTFHSFCNKVIQENPYYFGNRYLQPVSELEKIDLLYKLLDELPAGNPLRKLTGDVYSSAKSLKSLFETMKKEFLKPEELTAQINKYVENLPYDEKYIYKKGNAAKGIKAGDVKQKDVDAETQKMDRLKAAIAEFDNYNKLMQEGGRYDFDDMINWVIEAFRKHDELLGRYQEQFQYILVDEYQDTNGSQNEILHQLCSYYDNPNVFAVGDDDQSIYSFQGASMERIEQFVEQYRDSLTPIVLTQNYRSTQYVLDASKVLIEYNKERLVNSDTLKQMYTDRKMSGLSKDLTASNPEMAEGGNKIQVKAYLNRVHEEAAILNEIKQYAEAGGNLEEIAIIYRNHRTVENIIKGFQEHKIPYNARLSYNVLEEPIIKQLITILNYLQTEKEHINTGEAMLFELMHYPYFGIHPKDIAILSKTLSESRKMNWRELIGSPEQLFKLGLGTAGKISALDTNLNEWHKKLNSDTIQVLFEHILNFGGVLHYVMNQPEKIHQLECINTFFDHIKEETARNPKLQLGAYLEMLGKMEKNGISLLVYKVFTSEKGVHLVTAHSSKGLEFERVYIINANSDTWEGKRAPISGLQLPKEIFARKESDNNEEERRLFYVAMTRAKKHLQLSYQLMKVTDKDEESATLQRSLFVSEILEKYDIEVEKAQVEQSVLERYTLQTMKQPSIDGLMLERSYLDEVLKNYKLSVTHLNKYLICPLSFYFENILRVPAARSESMGFGNAIHKALEMLFKNMKERHGEFPTQEEFYGYFEFGMKLSASHFTDKQYQRRLEFGKEILPKYYNQYVNTWHKDVVLEYRVNNCALGDIPLSGAIDKVELLTGNRVNVIDYKTGEPANARKKLQRPGPTDPIGGDYWRQIVFYKLLLDNIKTQNWQMESGEIDFIQLPKDKQEFEKIKITVTPEDEVIVKTQVKETYVKIKNKEFTTGCGDKDCRWCNFVKYIEKKEYKTDAVVVLKDEEGEE